MEEQKRWFIEKQGNLLSWKYRHKTNRDLSIRLLISCFPYCQMLSIARYQENFVNPSTWGMLIGRIKKEEMTRLQINIF